MFDSHSSPPLMSELVPTYENSMDSISAEKVLKMTHLDLQKRFPILHVCPKCLAPFSAARRFYGTVWHSFRNWMRWKDTGRLVTWEFPLRIDSASWKSFGEL